MNDMNASAGDPASGGALRLGDALDRMNARHLDKIEEDCDEIDRLGRGRGELPRIRLQLGCLKIHLERQMRADREPDPSIAGGLRI